MTIYNTTSRRRAFSLTEILVVIAIIAILAGLGAWGTIAMIGTQQRRNTESTMQVVEKLLHSRWKSVIEDARKESPSPAILNLANGDMARAKVLWTKVRLVEAFPMRYAEVLPALPSPPNLPSIVNTFIPANRRKPHFTRYQTALAGKTGGGVGESSACLLMALRTLKGDGVTLDDQLKHAVVHFDGLNQIDLLNDGFGRPLVFFRFPISPVIQAANPAAGTNTGAGRYADPVDSNGTLLNVNWYLAPPTPPSLVNSRQIFESTTVFQQSRFHLISPNNGTNAYYTTPAIVSAGKDGRFGFTPDATFALTEFSPDMGILIPADANDNIYSFNLRGQ